MIIYIIAGVALIGITGGVIYYFRQKNKKKKGLFDDNSGADYIMQKDVTDRSAFINEIDTIIKSSEELGKLLGGVSTGGKLYDKVLSDKNLVKELRKAKSKEEVEKVLKKWTEKNYPEIKKILEGEAEEGSKEEASKLEKAKKKLEKAIKESGEKLKKKLSFQQEKKPKKEGENKEGEGEEKGESDGKEEGESKDAGKKTTVSEETRKVYKEVQLLLDKANVDRLIDIINNLKDEQIQELLDHYHKSLETDKLTLILKKADTPQDVINLLKSETINALKDEYERIKTLIGQARRKGHNVNAEWLALMKVPSKIKMFAATFRKKDFEKVKNALLEIDRKINFMLKEDEDKKAAKEAAEKKEEKPVETKQEEPKKEGENKEGEEKTKKPTEKPKEEKQEQSKTSQEEKKPVIKEPKKEISQEKKE